MNSREDLWVELGLWGSACFLWIMQTNPGTLWWQLASLWIALFLLSLYTKHKKAPTMGLLLIATFAMLGWLFMYRLHQSLAQSYWQNWLIGTIGYSIAFHINWSAIWHKYLYGVLTIALLVATILFGREIGGAKAWISLGSWQFQPVEFARVLLLLFLAGFFYDNNRLLKASQQTPLLRYWGPLFLLMSGVLLFLAVGRDLGPALLFYCLFVSLSLYAAFSWRLVLLYLCTSLIGVLVAWFQFPHFQQRVWIWLDPWSFEYGLGHQILQGLFTLHAGGFFGTGIGYGSGSAIPAVHTDYLFALIGEEMGLLGASLVLLLYLCLLFWGFKIAKLTTSKTHLLLIGILLLWGFQVFLVIAGILKLIPLTGMTLPFLSYGGSSLITNMCLLGIMASQGVKGNAHV